MALVWADSSQVVSKLNLLCTFILTLCYDKVVLSIHNRHYPIGVLYDMHGRGYELPWEVTVHFKVSSEFEYSIRFLCFDEPLTDNLLAIYY